MLEPDGRVIMISGANRGIGKAIASDLAKRGYSLSLGARNPSSIDLADYGDSTFVHQWDATSATDSATWVQATQDQFGRVDGVVLNAGVLLQVGLEQEADDDLDTLWEVNFKGPLRLVRAALPRLRESGHGRVVNVVSLAGKRLLGPENLGYAATKFASLALTHAVRQYGWDSGIRATAVCPGLVDTDMVTGVQVPEGQFKITPEAIACTAAYALSLPNEASVAEILVNSRLEKAM